MTFCSRSDLLFHAFHFFHGFSLAFHWLFTCFIGFFTISDKFLSSTSSTILCYSSNNTLTLIFFPIMLVLSHNNCLKQLWLMKNVRIGSSHLLSVHFVNPLFLLRLRVVRLDVEKVSTESEFIKLLTNIIRNRAFMCFIQCPIFHLRRAQASQQMSSSVTRLQQRNRLTIAFSNQIRVILRSFSVVIIVFRA